ncbi:MAG: hypothetical protein EZS28_016559 [Streblomastix strix]|uniref:Uncharacterized protein n=1 Tax=Streblomastix strix TaxID=222440 RepID=A0A5J4VZA3_9EUKA|nr:MAG: hypothetical protein EZS28_016559 [Streblomastix strix]
MREILDKWNIDIEISLVEYILQQRDRKYGQQITDLSLLSKFSGLYGITNKSIRAEGIGNIRKFNKLSANSDKNYGQASSNGKRKPIP